MIRLTLARGERILVNADLIEEVASTPATIIVLGNGRRLLVTETPAEVIERVQLLRASVLACADDILTADRAAVIPLPVAARA